MAQYLELNRSNAEAHAVLRYGRFYRDVFEMRSRSRVAGHCLTKRGKHGAEDNPHVWVPVHAAEWRVLC